MQVIDCLARQKPKQLVKSGLVKPIVAALCNICAEPLPEDYDEDDLEQPACVCASEVRTSSSCATLCKINFSLPQNIQRGHLVSVAPA